MTVQPVLPLTLETSILSVRNVLALAGLWLVYELVKALYNVSPLHPLNRIPGPKLAAATYWPEFYYDVVKFGCYTKEIRKMHEKYGELDRIEEASRLVSNAEAGWQVPLSASALMKYIVTTSHSPTRFMLLVGGNATSRCIKLTAQRRPPSPSRKVYTLNVYDLSVD